jgi:hypothetical protein
MHSVADAAAVLGWGRLVGAEPEEGAEKALSLAVLRCCSLEGGLVGSELSSAGLAGH